MACALCGRAHDGAPCATVGVSTPSERPFVGRRRELAELTNALDSAAAGRGRLLLVVGEAGIGKTRLADELGDRARARGILVLSGRCWEGGGAPVYWPWQQVMRAYAAARDANAVAHGLGRAAPRLAQIAPDVFDGAVEAVPDSRDAEPARFALFDATVMFLRAAARAEPVVLVLDDLHAADAPSLLLLQFLARDLRDVPLLVIGTYRDVEALRQPEVAAVLGALSREGYHVRLGGLGRDDVAAFMAQFIGQPASDALVRTVHEATDGNPFFVEEVVRLLVAEDRLDGDPERTPSLRIPDGVRATIRRRLDPLPSGVMRVLQIACVVGREFDLGLVERVAGAPVLPAVDEAVAAGVVASVDGRPGRFTFCHALIRETLVDGLAPADRMSLHRGVGQALEALVAADPEPHLAVLAHHFFQAAAPDDVDRAIDYSLRAAQRETTLLAYERAVAHCRRALHAADLAGIGGARRSELLLALGEAQGRAGDNAGSRSTFLAAADLGRRLGRPEILARAALGSGGAVLTPTAGIVDGQLVSLLTDALELLGDGDETLRARLLGRLAMELYYVGSRDRRDALSAEAVAIARGTGDAELLAYALNARVFALWGLEDTEERLQVAGEIIRLAERAGNAELALYGRIWRIVGELERGDIDVVDAEIEIHARHATELRQPHQLWFAQVFRAMRALLDGRFAEAEALAAAALELGQRQQAPGLVTSSGPNASLTHGIQRFNLYREQDRAAELIDEVTAFVLAYPTLPVWRCALAYLYAEAGRLGDAQRELDRIVEAGFATLPRDGNLLIALASLADVCAAVGDADRAALVYELLLPHEGRHIVISQGVACRGAVSHYLGVLAATTGAVEDAERHFADALAMHEKMRARPWLARTRAAYGQLLARSSSPADRRRSAELLRGALGLWEALGVGPAAARARAALDAIQDDVTVTSTPLPEVDTGRSGTFLREGDYWTVGLGDNLVRIRDAKGMRYLATLIAQPHTEVHALSLVTALNGGTSDGTIVAEVTSRGELALVGLGDVGPALDEHAKRAYADRIRDLHEELDEAQGNHDAGRAAGLREELDFLLHELSSATGLGGRDRKLGSPAERARIAVTKAIRTAVKRVAENAPDAGAHLDAAVRTGTYCSYSPDAASTVTWRRA